ncbi:MAG: hypothetical protein ACREUU_16270 [Gammaproteobacteria bacterium]
MTSPEEAIRLEADPMFRNAREKLLIKEDADGVRLSLYLDRAVVDNLGKGPGAGAESLQDFCLALEGVSHFLYLSWNATHDRSVTLLEMELQAEVDKFVVLSRYFEEHAETSPGGRLMRMLFQSVCFAPGLGEAEQRRYRRANRYAEQYCRRLEAGFLKSGNRKELLNDLRRFYRLPQREKIAYIGGVY